MAFERCAAAGLQAFGIWTAGAVDTAIASSTGVRALDSGDRRLHEGHRRATRAARSGWAAGTGTSIAALEPDALATRAAAKVTREEPVELPPGEYPVVLEHDAVGSLLEFLGGLAFDGLAHTEGRGALAGRLGERVAAPGIDLTDSPQFAGTLPRAVDAEGVPEARRSPSSATASPGRWCTTRARPRARGDGVHRPCPRPGRLGLWPGAHQPRARRRRRRATRPSSWRRSSAGST